MSYLILVFVCLVAYVNGANDVSKGVATLVGGGVLDARRAILWGTVTTLAGSLCAAVFVSGLLQTFSRGLLADVPPDAAFPLFVALGAALCVGLATVLGLPVSTTHAITGAIAGAALASLGPQGLLWSKLGTKVLLPLALSPVLSFVAARLVFPAVERAREASRLRRSRKAENPPAVPRGMSVSPDTVHLVSAGVTSFARGLNDTPKIVALVLGLAVLGPDLRLSFGLVAAAMAAGGLVSGRRVTDTMGRRITTMDPATGLLSNVVASTLVLLGTRYGLPLSTTQVTASAISGIGHASRQRVDWSVVKTILLAWLFTAPCAALLAAAAVLLYAVVA